jgi:hypothetical protein
MINYIDDKKIKTKMNQNSLFSNLSQKDKIDYFISLVVVMIAGAFVLYYSMPSTEINQNDNILLENSLDIDELEIEEAIYTPISEDVIKREKIAPVQKIKTVELPNRINQKNSSKNLIYKNRPTDTESTIIIDKINSREVQELPETPILVDSLETQQPIKIEKEQIDNDEITTETNTSTTSSEEMSKTENDITDTDISSNKDCVIVIGAYGKQKSIDKLTKRLLEENYEIFKTPYKGLTRVGVYLPCDKRKIQQELTTLRNKYAEDAMLLRKEN